ncbi:MAG: hypothetical protein ACE5R6_07770 [Candidatus Heimdallarchaeota archaeon]
MRTEEIQKIVSIGIPWMDRLFIFAEQPESRQNLGAMMNRMQEGIIVNMDHINSLSVCQRQAN